MNISLKELEETPELQSEDEIERIDCRDIRDDPRTSGQEILGRTVVQIQIGASITGEAVVLLHFDTGSMMVVEGGTVAISPAPFTIDRIHPINPTQQ